jgi:hypothetical protein
MEYRSAVAYPTHLDLYVESSKMNNELALRGLGQIDNVIKQQLAQILWNWELCGQCTAKPSCSQQDCYWSQVDGCGAFWEIHQQMTNAYSPERLGRRPALSNHQDVLYLVKHIRDWRKVPRDTVRLKVFEDDLSPEQQPPTRFDQNRALNIAAGLLLLMDFGVLQDAANLVSTGVSRNPWRDGVSVDAFIEEVFPRKPMSTAIKDMLPELKAKKLTKYGKLRIQATNDIRRHLVLDRQEKVVWIFHQGSALRQLLRSSEKDSATCVLPRVVVLEILDTIHTVLFPLDLGSQKLLGDLVLENNWDKGLLSHISTPYRKDGESPDTSYAYFGHRLEELYRELQAPTPHGWLQKRLQRRSETYMLMATMYGVIIAVTLGFFSLIVAIFQAWVAWQQLKQPAG